MPWSFCLTFHQTLFLAHFIETVLDIFAKLYLKIQIDPFHNFMTLTFTCDLEFAILHVVFGSVTVTEKLLRDKFYQISCTETHWHEQFKWIIIL